MDSSEGLKTISFLITPFEKHNVLNVLYSLVPWRAICPCCPGKPSLNLSDAANRQRILLLRLPRSSVHQILRERSVRLELTPFWNSERLSNAPHIDGVPSLNYGTVINALFFIDVSSVLNLHLPSEHSRINPRYTPRIMVITTYRLPSDTVLKSSLPLFGSHRPLQPRPLLFMMRFLGGSSSKRPAILTPKKQFTRRIL